MKKRRIMLAVYVMCLLLTACQNVPEEKEPVPVEATVTATSTPTFTPTPEPTATSTPTPTATATPTPEPTATATPTPTAMPVPTEVPVQKTEDTYKKGTLTENGFESEWMNLRFTPQYGMLLQTQEEVDEYIRKNAGLDADAAIDYSALSKIKEMHAYYATGTNLSVSVEKLTGLGLKITEESYIQLTIAQLRNLERVKELRIEDSYYDLEIGGEKYTGISIKVDYGKGEFLCQELIVRKKENRLITIAISYREVMEEEALNLLLAFGSYDSEPVVLPSPTPVPSTYEAGTLTENSFESEWLDLRFTATEEVKMYTREEAAQLLPVGAIVMFEDGLSEEELEAATDNLVIEMRACHESGANVLVQTDRIADGYAQNFSVEEFARSMINVLKNAANATYTIDEELFTVELCGESYVAFSAKAELGNGYVAYQEQLFRKKENRIISIVITYEKETMKDAQYLVTLFGTYDSEPTVVPKEIPTETENAFHAGVVTAEGYENEWLNLRITLPEQVTMVDTRTENGITLELLWEDGVPIVQFMIYDAEGKSEEAHLEDIKESILLLGEMQDMSYTFDEVSFIEIGGMEYLNLFMTAEMADDIVVGQNYCCRVQDDYMVSIIFTYADGYDEELREAVNAFSTY